MWDGEYTIGLQYLKSYDYLPVECEQIKEISDACGGQSIAVNPSKIRRYKGEGRGSIHWRMITKNGRDYPQAYYHYEFWSEGDRLVKSSKYIPKRLLNRV
jgi:hypothetical protein